MTEIIEFSAAVDAVDAITHAEHGDPKIDPRCVSFVLLHGRKTDRAIVLFHGFTNCPRQFKQLADVFFARGFNVYVPRLPRHGLCDKLTMELAGLSVDELVACATQSYNIAGGLGRRVSVLGLSMGATAVTWLAQTQALDRAVAVAPFFSVVNVPLPLEPALAGALELAPNLELWWDPRLEERAEPPHAYPRFATHALAQCLKLGETVRGLARDAAPLAALCVLVLNAKDPAIDNAAARHVWALWRKRDAAVDEYTFEDLDARHDIIEPVTYPDAATLVYPVLLRLVTGEA